MGPSRMSVHSLDRINEDTRNEWRARGFFYDYDDRRGNWLFRASRSGFAKLCFELRQYAIDSKHALTSPA